MGSSPRGGSLASAEAPCGADTITSYSSSVNGNYHTGLKTPSPDQSHQAYRKDSVQAGLHSQAIAYTTYDQSSGTYISMNQPQTYMDVTQSHMPSSVSSSGPPPAMGHYSSYQQPQPMQSTPHSYASSPTSYSQYGYPSGLAPLHSSNHNGATSMSGQLVPQSHPSLPSKFGKE